MNLVKFKGPIWLNPEQVAVVRPKDGGGTDVWLIGDEYPLSLEEPVDKVISLLCD
jgi:hypothetical protein